jgi:hypothetical protein
MRTALSAQLRQGVHRGDAEDAGDQVGIPGLFKQFGRQAAAEAAGEGHDLLAHAQRPSCTALLGVVWQAPAVPQSSAAPVK